MLPLQIGCQVENGAADLQKKILTLFGVQINYLLLSKKKAY